MDGLVPRGGSLPPGASGDGAFERFLTAAIAAIITIMFSWRLLDDMNGAERTSAEGEQGEACAAPFPPTNTQTHRPTVDFDIDEDTFCTVHMLAGSTDYSSGIYDKPVAENDETDVDHTPDMVHRMMDPAHYDQCFEETVIPSDTNAVGVAHYDDDDDVEPRELDSDEELYCCSLLEPILEEDSDDFLSSSDDSQHRNYQCVSELVSASSSDREETDMVTVDEDRQCEERDVEAEVEYYSADRNPETQRADADDSESDESVQTVVLRSGSVSDGSTESSPSCGAQGKQASNRDGSSSTGLPPLFQQSDVKQDLHDIPDAYMPVESISLVRFPGDIQYIYDESAVVTNYREHEEEIHAPSDGKEAPKPGTKFVPKSYDLSWVPPKQDSVPSATADEPDFNPQNVKVSYTEDTSDRSTKITPVPTEANRILLHYIVPPSPEIKATTFPSGDDDVPLPACNPADRLGSTFSDADLSSGTEQTPSVSISVQHGTRISEGAANYQVTHVSRAASVFQDADISSGTEETPKGYIFMRCESEASRSEQRIFLVDRPLAPDFETFINAIPFTSEGINRGYAVLCESDDYSAFVKELSRSDGLEPGYADEVDCILSGNLVSPYSANAFPFTVPSSLPTVSVCHSLAAGPTSIGQTKFPVDESSKETDETAGNMHSKTESSDGLLNTSFDTDTADEKKGMESAFVQTGKTVLCPSSDEPVETIDPTVDMQHMSVGNSITPLDSDREKGEHKFTVVEEGESVKCPPCTTCSIDQSWSNDEENVQENMAVDISPIILSPQVTCPDMCQENPLEGPDDLFIHLSNHSAENVGLVSSVAQRTSPHTNDGSHVQEDAALDSAEQMTSLAHQTHIIPPQPKPRRLFSSTSSVEMGPPVPLPRTRRDEEVFETLPKQDNVAQIQDTSPQFPQGNQSDSLSSNDGDVSEEDAHLETHVSEEDTHLETHVSEEDAHLETHVSEEDAHLETHVSEEDAHLETHVSEECAAQFVTPKQTPFSQFEEKRPRSLKEIRRKLAQNRVASGGRPAISPFVVPDHMLTPSRLRIMASRKRFFSSDSLQSGGGNTINDQFAVYQASEQQQKQRRYKPHNRPLSTSSTFSSQDHLEKLQNMLNWSRHSESSLDRPPIDHLHDDCIFTPQGRRNILDKTLSIENIHLNLPDHLRKYGSVTSLVETDIDSGETLQTNYFPETNLDVFDVLFQSHQSLQRSASMSDLHVGTSGVRVKPSQPSSSRKTGKDRFTMHRFYKKSKSLCTLETNIDEVATGNEDNLKRVPSVHELRVTKSLQKLNVPDWFKQSSLSKSSSCLLKYGSNSTMNSFTFSPSLVSSPCASTAPPATNVVIKTRVVPPSKTRSLRSPGMFASHSSSGEWKVPPTPVKLPSEKFREKEKQKSLMPIPIVPFAQIRAMFENKVKSEQKVDSTAMRKDSGTVPVISVTQVDGEDKTRTREFPPEKTKNLSLDDSDTSPRVQFDPIKAKAMEADQKSNATHAHVKSRTLALPVREITTAPDSDSVFPASVNVVTNGRKEALETKGARHTPDYPLSGDAKGSAQHKETKSYSPSKSMKTFWGFSKEKRLETKQETQHDSSLPGEEIYENEPKRRVGASAQGFERKNVGSGGGSANRSFGDNANSSLQNKAQGVSLRSEPTSLSQEKWSADAEMRTLPSILETPTRQQHSVASTEQQPGDDVSADDSKTLSSENGGFRKVQDQRIPWTTLKAKPTETRSLKETTV